MKHVLPFLLLPLFWFSSCKEKINIDIPEGSPKLVIEAEVTTETDSSYVRLSLSSNYFSSGQYNKVTNALVSVNGIPFTHKSNGLYRPASPYTGKTDSSYHLSVTYNGNTYTSDAVLERMFRVDSLFQIYKPAEGFLKEGFSVSYAGFDNRAQIKYTFFEAGYFDTIIQRDSMNARRILFDNSQTPINEPYVFELPFTRYHPGDVFFCIFRSVDKNMNDFISAYNDQDGNTPGPFQVPPANLPTNIRGGAIGYFATYDVKRLRYTVRKP